MVQPLKLAMPALTVLVSPPGQFSVPGPEATLSVTWVALSEVTTAPDESLTATAAVGRRLGPGQLEARYVPATVLEHSGNRAADLVVGFSAADGVCHEGIDRTIERGVVEVGDARPARPGGWRVEPRIDTAVARARVWPVEEHVVGDELGAERR
jgi:hypothetical protein